jgi:hypothetical protein
MGYKSVLATADKNQPPTKLHTRTQPINWNLRLEQNVSLFYCLTFFIPSRNFSKE